MVVVAALGAAILPGDFIIAKRSDLSHGVCRVRCIVLPHSFEVEWWTEPTNPPPICQNLFPNVLMSRLRELSSSDTTPSVIHCESVVDVAFVFAVEVLEHMWTDTSGMTKVFFTRIPSHIPFSLCVSESYPSRIWFSLISVKELVRKMMSCKRQMHVCKRAESIPFSLEGWRYISMFLQPVYYEKGQTKIHQYSDLSLQSKSSIKNCSMIRIVSQDKMETARELFGITFGIGTRNIPPRKGLPRKVLEVGNIVNLVNVSEQEIVAEGRKVKELIGKQRIDLVYEEATRTLTVRIMYRDEKAEAPIVSAILGFPMINVTPPARNPEHRARRVRTVPVDTVFLYNEKFFTVTYSNGTRVNATCYDDGEDISLDNEFLWNLILET